MAVIKTLSLSLMFAGGILIMLFGINSCSDMPYTGSMLQPGDVDKYLYLPGDGRICLTNGFETACLTLVPKRRDGTIPIIHIYPSSIKYIFYHEGVPILQAERLMDTTEIVEQIKDAEENKQPRDSGIGSIDIPTPPPPPEDPLPVDPPPPDTGNGGGQTPGDIDGGGNQQPPGGQQPGGGNQQPPGDTGGGGNGGKNNNGDDQTPPGNTGGGQTPGGNQQPPGNTGGGNQQPPGGQQPRDNGGGNQQPPGNTGGGGNGGKNNNGDDQTPPGNTGDGQTPGGNQQPPGNTGGGGNQQPPGGQQPRDNGGGNQQPPGNTGGSGNSGGNNNNGDDQTPPGNTGDGQTPGGNQQPPGNTGGGGNQQPPGGQQPRDNGGGNQQPPGNTGGGQTPPGNNNPPLNNPNPSGHNPPDNVMSHLVYGHADDDPVHYTGDGWVIWIFYPHNYVEQGHPRGDIDIGQSSGFTVSVSGGTRTNFVQTSGTCTDELIGPPPPFDRVDNRQPGKDNRDDYDDTPCGADGSDYSVQFFVKSSADKITITISWTHGMYAGQTQRFNIMKEVNMREYDANPPPDPGHTNQERWN